VTYFSDEQVRLLLKPIHPKRVRFRDGMSHVEGYDIRAELTRVFGFGRWSSEVLEQTVLCERETRTKTYTDKKTGEQRGGHPAWYVVYRSRVRLKVHAPDGTLITFHDGTHVGASTHPDFGEAHGNALTNSETYALRRAAINLGDQFGLSLYNKGSMDALVRWTLVRPEQAAEASTTDTDDVPQVAAESAEASGSTEEEDAGTAFDEAEVPEPVAAPRDADEADMADEARAAVAARAAARDREYRAATGRPAGDTWERPWLDMALEAAAGLPSEAAAGKLWKESAAKAHAREITRDEAARVQDLISARVDDLRKEAVTAALNLLSENDEWRLKVEELADEESARAALSELGRLVTAEKVDMTRANRISRAIAARFPQSVKNQDAAA
jgi:Rad52/22 family double-strand break repair protein